MQFIASDVSLHGVDLWRLQGFYKPISMYNCHSLVALNVLHTIWVREHNRIARKLKQIKTGWNGEKVYQETRKIIGAMMQHITYNEYLPALLSEEVVSMLVALLDIFHRGPIYVERGRETGGLNLPPLVILLKALHFRFRPLLSWISPFSPFSSAKYKALLSTFPLFIRLLALLVLPPPALSFPASRTPPVHRAP